MNGSTFRNGSASYQVASYGYSYGYFIYTPSKTQTISIKASVSSESRCDYGACYIGTRQYKASFDAVVKRWAEKGIVIEYHEDKDILKSTYTIKELSKA